MRIPLTRKLLLLGVTISSFFLLFLFSFSSLFSPVDPELWKIVKKIMIFDISEIDPKSTFGMIFGVTKRWEYQ